MYIIPALFAGLMLYNRYDFPLKIGQKSFTFYYWKKCHHCRAMYPDVRRLGGYVGSTKIRWVEESYNNELEVNSFPTLIYRDSNGTIEEYKGNRSYAAMKQFLLTK
jgi:hypothetical protein